MNNNIKLHAVKAIYWLMATMFSMRLPAPYLLLVTPLCLRRFFLHAQIFFNYYMQH